MQKEIILALLLIGFYKSVYSQNNKIEFHSVSFSMGILIPQNGKPIQHPFHSNLQISSKINNNLISMSLDGAINWYAFFIGNFDINNIQPSVLYGRNVKLGEAINIETHTGIGYFWSTYRKNDNENWENEYPYLKKTPSDNINKATFGSFSIPIKVKILINLQDKSSFGINFNSSINSISNFKTFGLVFQQNL